MEFAIPQGDAYRQMSTWGLKNAIAFQLMQVLHCKLGIDLFFVQYGGGANNLAFRRRGKEKAGVNKFT